MMSMAQPFPPHPTGMPPQPGFPQGHPMATAHQPNQGQPGIVQQPGQAIPQQMHPMVSAPGGPQATQGGPVMAAMPAGTVVPAGGPVGPPSAHALSHLNPGQAQLFQHQQMAQALANNPQFLQQHQHQQQQLLRQRALLQAQQNNGMPMGLPNGGNPNLNAAQFAAMQNNPMRPVNLPHHMQQQQLAAQQAAQQQQHQQQQHQQQQQMLAQHLAIQQAQQANAAAQAGGHGQQVPGVPQQQIQSLQNAQAVAAVQHQQRQQQQQQQQQQHAVQQQQQQHQHQQQQAVAAAMMQPRIQHALKGGFVLQMLQFADHLSQSTELNQQNDIGYWQRFVDQFFSQGAVLRQSLHCYSDQTSKQFEISTSTLARFYCTHFDSGVRKIQMILQDAREKEISNNCHCVESDKASFIYWFENGNHLIMSGTLRAQFDQNSKIDVLDFGTMTHMEYVSRACIKHLSSPHSSPEGKSPGQHKNAKQKAQRVQPQVKVPESQVNPWGVTDAVMRFLELSETISHMQPLFAFSQANAHLAPSEALNELVANFNAQTQFGAQNMHFPQNAVNAQAQLPAGVRTPGPLPNNMANQFQLGASPSTSHLGLPGSPHIGSQPSPGQNNVMQAPGLVAQHSQQGTNSSQGTSTNTSPNVPNKRRRPSGVKVDGDDGEVNGTMPSKVKPSPRIGGKRQKGTQA